jgi:hypothetical protein
MFDLATGIPRGLAARGGEFGEVAAREGMKVEEGL